MNDSRKTVKRIITPGRCDETKTDVGGGGEGEEEEEEMKTP